jgi:ParB-like nuclease domain
MIRRGEIGKTDVVDIVIPTDRWRKPSVQQIEVMRKSLRENGLLIPIAVRLVDEIIIDGAPRRAVPVLVHGATRLAAAKAEGWEEIDTQILEGSDVDFEKAEIAENLHRGELTKLDRDRQLARYIRLCEAEVTAPEGPKPKGGRPEGGVRAAARELNIPKTTAQKAITTESITAPAAAAIADLGLANSPSAYREVAAEAPHAQVAKAGEVAQRREQRRAAKEPSTAQANVADNVATEPMDEQPQVVTDVGGDGRHLKTMWERANPGLPRGSEPAPAAAKTKLQPDSPAAETEARQEPAPPVIAPSLAAAAALGLHELFHRLAAQLPDERSEEDERQYDKIDLKNLLDEMAGPFAKLCDVLFDVGDRDCAEEIAKVFGFPISLMPLTWGEVRDAVAAAKLSKKDLRALGCPGFLAREERLDNADSMEVVEGLNRKLLEGLSVSDLHECRYLLERVRITPGPVLGPAEPALAAPAGLTEDVEPMAAAAPAGVDQVGPSEPANGLQVEPPSEEISPTAAVEKPATPEEVTARAAGDELSPVARLVAANNLAMPVMPKELRRNPVEGSTMLTAMPAATVAEAVTA